MSAAGQLTTGEGQRRRKPERWSRIEVGARMRHACLAVCGTGPDVQLVKDQAEWQSGLSIQA